MEDARGEAVVRVLVERDRELPVLAAAIEGAEKGAGSLVLVEGVAGIGKTSLLAEAGRLARRAGARVVAGRGTQLERQSSFGLVRQWFDLLLVAMDHRERDSVLAGAAAPAGTVLGVAGPAATGIGDFAALHGLFWMTANLAERHVMVLLADDLHWADRGSLRFLTYLLPRLDGLPVAVVAATRPHEPAAEQHLLDLLSVDPACTVLRPEPLSPAGSASMFTEALRIDDLDPAFAAACHTATGGNPLLLAELARAVVEEKLAPTTGNAAHVERLGTPSLSTRVRLRLAQLPDDCAALTDAVAVLGDRTPLDQAAALAELDYQRAAQAADQLQRIAVLAAEESGQDPGRPGGVPPLSFVHPLIRGAVYDQINPARRTAAHAAAASLLNRMGADPEHAAIHLLQVPPAGEAEAVDTLRRAAANAARRGTPETAVACLERCVREPLPDTERLAVLEELGLAAMLVDGTKAVAYLRQARDLAGDAPRRAALADALGAALYLGGHVQDAAAVYQDALAELGDGERELRRRLQGNLLVVAMDSPGTRAIADDLADLLRDIEEDHSLGGRMLDGLVAYHDAMVLVAPEAAERAWRCVRDGTMVEQANGSIALAVACWVLTCAEWPEVGPVLDTALRRASLDGSLLGLLPAKIVRGNLWLRRGSLAEAEADARDAAHAVDVTLLDSVRPVVAGLLGEILLEQGRLADAEARLAWAGDVRSLPAAAEVCYVLASRARILLEQDRAENALRTILECGERYSAFGWRNPAFIAWRSTAALAMHRLGRASEAQYLANEELDLARRWGAPRALGRALRVAGLVNGGRDGLDLLLEAVATLEKSLAQLELGKTLVDLGAMIRRHGHRDDAKTHLLRGLKLAEHCGAAPLALRAVAELRTAGGRARPRTMTGPQALTPSERAVAELAADGLTNRDIAQRLFITVKTVEIHLSSAYRKLGISRRHQLTAQLQPERTPG